MSDIEARCKYCNQPIKTQTANLKSFCCRQCVQLYRKQNMVNHQCMYCGEILSVFKNTNSNIIGYCCSQCAAKHFNTFHNTGGGACIVKRCKNCNNLFICKNYTDIKHNHQFCSRKCDAENKRLTGRCKIPLNKQVRLDKVCEYCGKHYKVHPYRKDSRFCSKKCHYASGVCTVKCVNCGCEYTVEQNIYNNSASRRMYCDKCRPPHTRSAFEVEVCRILQSKLSKDRVVTNHRVTYTTDKGRNISLFPDMIVDNKLIIECNGDFFHCNPKFYREDFINPKTGHTAENIWKRDKFKYNMYAEKGFKTIVIWESDWNANKSLIIENILHEIQ